MAILAGGIIGAATKRRRVGVVLTRGYHSHSRVASALQQALPRCVQSTNAGRRRWTKQRKAHHTTYASRRRIRRERDRMLRCTRDHRLNSRFFPRSKRSMHPVHLLRYRQNTLKQVPLHGVASNVTLIMREALASRTNCGFVGVISDLLDLPAITTNSNVTTMSFWSCFDFPVRPDGFVSPRGLLAIPWIATITMNED